MFGDMYDGHNKSLRGQNAFQLISSVIRLILLPILVLAISSPHNMAQTNSSPAKRDINAVLRAHEKQLMAIPDVVGVYVGVLADGKTPCLKVMLAKETHRHDIPGELEGYTVMTEVTGEIRPLGTP
jgi:hypothetical protein